MHRLKFAQDGEVVDLKTSRRLQSISLQTLSAKMHAVKFVNRDAQNVLLTRLNIFSQASMFHSLAKHRIPQRTLEREWFTSEVA